MANTQHKPKYWMGRTPQCCDLCYRPITDFKKIVDGATVIQFVDGKTMMGPWGILCPECHEARGQGLGEGKGQLYRWNGQYWAKVEDDDAKT